MGYIRASSFALIIPQIQLIILNFYINIRWVYYLIRFLFIIFTQIINLNYNFVSLLLLAIYRINIVYE